MLEQLITDRDQPTNPRRWRTDDEQDRLGALGELAGSRTFGYPMDFTNDRGGDGGIDREIEFNRANGPEWVFCDVKCSVVGSGPYFLIWKKQADEGEHHIFMAALCDKQMGWAKLTGWCWGWEAWDYKVKAHRGAGSAAYHVPRRKLHRISFLLARYTGNSKVSRFKRLHP